MQGIHAWCEVLSGCFGAQGLRPGAFVAKLPKQNVRVSHVVRAKDDAEKKEEQEKKAVQQKEVKEKKDAVAKVPIRVKLPSQ